MTHIDTLPLFGEPDRPEVHVAPLVVAVQWSNFQPASRVQCMHCVQLVHARRGDGPVNIRTARRRRTGPDGELLLCADHAETKHTADMAAGLVPSPKRRPAGRKAA